MYSGGSWCLLAVPLVVLSVLWVRLEKANNVVRKVQEAEVPVVRMCLVRECLLVKGRAKRSQLQSQFEGYLAGGEQKALRDVVGLIGEELVHLPGDLDGGLAQPQQRNVDAVAQNVLDHHLGLAGNSAAEELA